MITVLFKLNDLRSRSLATVSNQDDLLDLVRALEEAPSVMHYAIVDNTYSVDLVDTVAYYNWIPEAFPKFKPVEEF